MRESLIPKLRTKVNNFGGDEENRTPDPLLARQVLSQLSYAPMYGYVLKWWA